MATKLRDLKLDRIDLVDEPANPKARVVLFKRAGQPAIGDVHVNRPDWLVKELAGEMPIGKPYPNEHAARLQPPDKYSTFARTNDKFGPGIDAIFGIRSVDGERTSELQAIRFDRQKFTPAQAKAWLKDHQYSTASFEPAQDTKEKSTMKARLRKQRADKELFKRLVALGKAAAAGPLSDWAAREEAESEQKEAEGDADARKEAEAEAEAEARYKDAADKLGEALKAYGDGAGLPADHPFHGLKALHKEMCTKLAEADARRKEAEGRKAAEAEGEAEAEAEGEAEAEAEGEAEGEALGRVRKQQVTVSKQVVELQKALTIARAEAAEAKAIAKAEKDRRELEEHKVSLRKFRGLSVDAEKDAAIFKRLAETDPATHKRVNEILSAANAMVVKTNLLESQLGSDLGGGLNGTAWAEICAEADKLVQKDSKLTVEKARDLVMQKRPELVARYNEEDLPNERVIRG